MNFIEEMRGRGLVAQVTHEPELLDHVGTKRTAYIGFDPTASSLHVGHLLPVMLLARWQQSGHRAIALMGGGTALVGDPTGKTSMRKMLTEEAIGQNIENFKKQVQDLVSFNSSDDGIILNNADWLCDLNYLDFLREIGSQFSVNRMLGAECFKSRMETGLSFLEFNYMLLQGYDFYHLSKTQNCTVQLGGDDQWSNMLAGMDLVRRMNQQQVYCMTNPLLTTSEGKKMGKTEGGAVWLDPSLTPPYEYFQYWRNVSDDMVGACLRYFTFLPMEEVQELENLEGADINQAKQRLAYEATAIIHGDEEAKKAKEAATKLFSTSGSQLSGGSEPEVVILASVFGSEMAVMDILVEAKAAPSKGEARRLIKQGGVSIDGEKVVDINAKLARSDIDDQKGALIKKGKKHYYRLRISD